MSIELARQYLRQIIDGAPDPRATARRALIELEDKRSAPQPDGLSGLTSGMAITSGKADDDNS